MNEALSPHLLRLSCSSLFCSRTLSSTALSSPSLVRTWLSFLEGIVSFQEGAQRTPSTMKLKKRTNLVAELKRKTVKGGRVFEGAFQEKEQSLYPHTVQTQDYCIVGNGHRSFIPFIVEVVLFVTISLLRLRDILWRTWRGWIPRSASWIKRNENS